MATVLRTTMEAVSALAFVLALCITRWLGKLCVSNVFKKWTAVHSSVWKNRCISVWWYRCLYHSHQGQPVESQYVSGVSTSVTQAFRQWVHLCVHALQKLPVTYHIWFHHLQARITSICESCNSTSWTASCLYPDDSLWDSELLPIQWPSILHQTAEQVNKQWPGYRTSLWILQ